MRSNIGMGIALVAALVALPVFGQQRSDIMVHKDASYLGIGVHEVDSDRAKALKLKEERGAELTQVDADGPAAKAGLRPGDVILEYNGTPVEGVEQLQRLVRDTPANHTVKIVIWRNGASQTVAATVGQRKGLWVETPSGEMVIPMPAVPPMPPMGTVPAMSVPRVITVMPTAMLGIEGEALNQEPQFAEYMGVKDGVLVKAVNRNSAADRAGIKAGDVIVKVDDAHVSSTFEITSALRSSRGKKNFNLTLVRNKKEMPLAVTIE